MASALYAYTPPDAGDLAIQPNDRIAITEFINADWAKGRNERTAQEGISPAAILPFFTMTHSPVSSSIRSASASSIESSYLYIRISSLYSPSQDGKE